jgi:hypothetical protein
MWTFDEIQNMNAPSPGQRDSILSFILGVNAATPDVLCYAADQLEQYGVAYVCCFAQLPFPIFVEPGKYAVRADTENVIMEMEFQLAELTVSDRGQTQFTPVTGQSAAGDARGSWGTQVLGFIPLWGRRTLYYKNYIACLHGNGLRNQVINPALQDGRGYGYKGTVVTSQSFESELPKKMLDEFPIALRRFLINYSLLALEDVPLRPALYGYFVMAAPGRIVYKEPPIPITKGMLSVHPHRLPLDRPKVLDALKISYRENDRFIHQLQAMKRVASAGEPELAIVGTVSAIEWFANRFVVPPKDRYKDSHSLRNALKLPPLSNLPEVLKAELLRVADLRNSLVHGKPPDRGDNRSLSHNVASVLNSAVELYRQLNAQRVAAIPGL